MLASVMPNNANLRRMAPIIGAVACIWLLVTAFLISQHPPSLLKEYMGSDTCGSGIRYNFTDHLESIVQALWAPLKVSITAPSFTDREGEVHELTQKPRYTKKLGKRMVILDVDTRSLNAEGQVCAAEPPTWDNLEHLSGGMLSHQLYAMIHGYDYKFVRSPAYRGHHGTWVKVPMAHELLKDYDWVVTIDADAEFTNPELPLEWMMNYWNFTKDTALAAAADPAGGPNLDAQGHANLNTGFFFSQAASPKIQEIYEAWGSCTEAKRYPQCAKWKTERFHEQQALSEYVRYDYWDYIKTLPCNQANGYPEVADSGCRGQFVKHFWMDKTLAKRQLADGVMQALIPQLWSAFQGTIIDSSNKSIASDGLTINNTPPEPEELEER